MYNLRKKVQLGQSDLDRLDKQISELPELITSANLLRSNEHLLKINDKKTDLLLTYRQYSQALEELLASVFEIQKDLKDILKEQSSIIADQLAAESDLQSKPKHRSQPTTKSKPKTGTKTSPKPRPKPRPKPKTGTKTSPKPRPKPRPKPKTGTKTSPKPRPKPRPKPKTGTKASSKLRPKSKTGKR